MNRTYEVPCGGSYSSEILLSHRGIGRWLKMDHGFAGFGVAEFFAGQAGDGIGIILQGVDLGLEFVGAGLFLLDFVLQPHNVGAHPLVLLNERQVAHANQQQYGNNDQRRGDFGQFAPDAEVYVHPAS